MKFLDWIKVLVFSFCVSGFLFVVAGFSFGVWLTGGLP